MTEIVKEKGLAKGKIGVEEKTLPIVDFRNITASLPDVEFVDASKTLLDIRAVKLPEPQNQKKSKRIPKTNR